MKNSTTEHSDATSAMGILVMIVLEITVALLEHLVEQHTMVAT